MATIRTFYDLCAHLYADNGKMTVAGLNHRLHKDTECGASLSLYGKYKGKNAVIHNPGRIINVGPREEVPLRDDGALHRGFVPEAFTIQTIVEGSDAVVDSGKFLFGKVTTKEIDEWIEYMEAEAARLWDEANSAEEI